MTLDQLVAAIRSAHDSHTPLRIRGAGSKDFYGGMLAGEVLDVSGYQGIVAYEPTELFLTAKGGTPLAEIEAVLAARISMAACWPVTCSILPPIAASSPMNQPSCTSPPAAVRR